MLENLVQKNRSYRRFFEEADVSAETLKDLIGLARLTASGANKQALRYYISASKEQNEKIYPELGWAGYFKDWHGPIEGERPSAYIILLQKEDYKLGTVYDVGIAAQTILLGAVEKGLGGCMIANIHRQRLHQSLSLPDNMEILLVLAIGKPKEKVVIDEVSAGESIKYWRDEDGTHHVPKVKLADLIIK